MASSGVRSSCSINWHAPARRCARSQTPSGVIQCKTMSKQLYTHSILDFQRFPSGGRAVDVRCQVAEAEVTVKQIAKDPELAEMAYLATRTSTIRKSFPSALAVDEFIHRLEIALYAYGFTGDNSIACTNLCRDEITITVKNKIDQVFGSSFNTNGLGGVLTCGVTGVKAGLSHSPTCASSGKERYVFFSMPHISIDAAGAVGKISRPGRPGESCACGALIGSLVQIKAAGLEASCKKPGVHDYDDPELSILKQRLARRMRYEGWSQDHVQEMDLVDITKLAERTIIDDLEFLIKNAVDPSKADYAVVTGVQVHNWGVNFDDGSPNLEFVAPTGVYVVVNGEKTYIDLETVPALTPRQVSLLAGAYGKPGTSDHHVTNSAGYTTVRSIDAPFLYSTTSQLKAKEERAKTYIDLLGEEQLTGGGFSEWPTWKSRIAADVQKDGRDNSTVIDELEKSTPDVDSLTSEFLDRLRQVASQQLLNNIKKE